MEIKEFYKELYAGVSRILKPHGFRKKGDSFRQILDNGITWEIHFHRNDYRTPAMHRFEVEVYIALFPVPAPEDIWKRNKSQIHGLLGDKADGYWRYQKCYDLSPLVNPKMNAQLRDGKMPLRFQEPGKEMQTRWIPCPSFEEIIAEICAMLEQKFLPLYQSVQTLDAFAGLLERDHDFFISSHIGNMKLYVQLLGVRMLPLLEQWREGREHYLEYLLSTDISAYDANALCSHEHTLEIVKGQIEAYQEILKQLQE